MLELENVTKSIEKCVDSIGVLISTQTQEFSEVDNKNILLSIHKELKNCSSELNSYLNKFDLASKSKEGEFYELYENLVTVHS